MTDNGWEKYQREVLGKIHDLRTDVRSILKKFDDYTSECDKRFAATEIETAKVKATVKERAWFYGMMAGCFPFGIYLILELAK